MKIEHSRIGTDNGDEEGHAAGQVLGLGVPLRICLPAFSNISKTKTFKAYFHINIQTNNEGEDQGGQLAPSGLHPLPPGPARPRGDAMDADDDDDETLQLRLAAALGGGGGAEPAEREEASEAGVPPGADAEGAEEDEEEELSLNPEHFPQSPEQIYLTKT